jgi:hypothetical protein
MLSVCIILSITRYGTAIPPSFRSWRTVCLIPTVSVAASDRSVTAMSRECVV